MEIRRNNPSVLARLLSHVGIIYAPSLRIAGRAGMCQPKAAYWLTVLVRRGLVQRRRTSSGAYEYRLTPKQRRRAAAATAHPNGFSLTMEDA